MYLESSALKNNAYYQKFGFAVKKDIFLKRGPTPVLLSIMVREPQPPAAKNTNIITTTAITGRKPTKATAAVRMV